jgi:hypothetical protein
MTFVKITMPNGGEVVHPHESTGELAFERAANGGLVAATVLDVGEHDMTPPTHQGTVRHRLIVHSPDSATYQMINPHVHQPAAIESWADGEESVFGGWSQHMPDDLERLHIVEGNPSERRLLIATIQYWPTKDVIVIPDFSERAIASALEKLQGMQKPPLDKRSGFGSRFKWRSRRARP